MISTSAFLPCTMISGVRESIGRLWQSILHQFTIVDDHFWKPNRKKKSSNVGRKELVSG